MKHLIFIATLTLSSIILNSCGLLGSSEEKQKEELYEWKQLVGFKSGSITAIATHGENVLYIAQSNRLSYSEEAGKNIKRFTAPDSADITKIKVYDRLYIIGDVYRSGAGFWGNRVSYVYASDDNGSNWEEIVGGFRMQDIVVSENMLHIGKKHGVITFDLEGDSVYKSNLFLYSKLSDHMEEITASADGSVYVSSHGGIFATFDRGTTWEKISTTIGKDYDHIKSIAVDDESDMIYAAEYRRLYYREKNEVKWIKKSINSGTEKVRLLSDNKIVTVDWDQVNYADKNSFEFQNIGPYYEQKESEYFSLEMLEVFTDNKIVVAGDEHIFVGTPINN
ncbi:MAG TPA: hypothetical protein DF712_04925 [Balneola sp.]|nr:hypothetical protein [Bacteroidota bacterium]HCT51783.1 hypothetical protein [Balneola sp.]|tara:strand:+ start:943 stop:1950 length:1008 start_codon:yes stop_codon:yes gene_type:complete